MKERIATLSSVVNDLSGGSGTAASALMLGYLKNDPSVLQQTFPHFFKRKNLPLQKVWITK